MLATRGSGKVTKVEVLAKKGHKVSRAHIVGPRNKKLYAGKLPHCNRCKYHHTRLYTAKCENCKRIGHQTKDCRSLAAATNQRAPVANQRTFTCFECGKQRHYRSECPKLKNQNPRNKSNVMACNANA
ncbi:reverse transcriptase domain-containing protein [Tanacetum coccineum]